MQKGCKKLMVKVKRLDLRKMGCSSKEKDQNSCTPIMTVSKPNTRKKKISYKPNEYKPKCKCGCAVVLQEQCPVKISKKPTTFKRKLNVATKTALVPKTIQTDCKRVIVKVRRIRPTISETDSTKNKVGDISKLHETTCFCPVRNSNIFGKGEETGSKVVHRDETESLSKGFLNSSENFAEENVKRKSLTNKPDLIEQLLFSEEDDEEQENHVREDFSVAEYDAIVNRTKANKFFHRKSLKKIKPTKKFMERKKVFEFLSQSDNSEPENEKHRDPAADIINKLISEGRVQVATNHKGTGRPILKRVRKKPTFHSKKKILKIKTKKNTADTKSYKNNDQHEGSVNGDKTLPPVPKPDIGYEDDNGHFDDSVNEYVNDRGFSRLARSVLLQETRRNETTRKMDITEQRRLLEAARKFVSTPAGNRKNESLPDLSPIQMLTKQSRPACPSPWRIDDNLHLPRVFNFSKNTSYLPTFSSDYIPSTPKKVTPKRKHVYIDSIVPAVEANLANGINCETSGSSNNSSKSTNDSNAENMPPPATSTPATVSKKDVNADISNLRQLPNPRRTLTNRSPLKAINIIEVVTLPPWKSPINNNNEQNKIDIITTNVKEHNDLFGFNEFIDQDSSEGDESSNTNIQTIERNLHQKLMSLKNWRPKKMVNGIANITPVKPCNLFDDDKGRPKQRLIKDMLCSTMINHQVNAVTEGKRKDGNFDTNMEEINTQPIEADFFNDYEPETTMNEKQPRQTYARPVKRKRKTRKDYVRFLYSDESNSDSDEEQKELRKEDNKKRRHETHAKAKGNPELDSFVNEFNSMCKEVENYELIVE